MHTDALRASLRRWLRSQPQPLELIAALSGVPHARLRALQRGQRIPVRDLIALWTHATR